MDDLTHKVWGTTQPLIVTPLFEVHRLTVKAMHRCSMHVHRTKHNAFYITGGTVYVDTVDGDIGGTVREHKLRTCESMTVPPGVFHQFRTDVEGCELLEMYYTEPLSEDIQRLNEGGPVWSS